MTRENVYQEHCLNGQFARRLGDANIGCALQIPPGDRLLICQDETRLLQA